MAEIISVPATITEAADHRPIAYAYARYSHSAQADGDSLRRQTKAAEEYAEEHGLKLDTSLRDLGVSAYTGENLVKGALASFLERVKRGDIERGSYLLVDSFDRLSRETVDVAVYTLLSMTKEDINVVTLNDRHVYRKGASMMDLMFAVMHAARSHEESREKGRKVAKAHGESKRKAREELVVWHRTGPSWLLYDEHKRRFEPIPEQVRNVRRIFDLIEQGMGTSAIAKRFNDEKLASPRNGKKGWQHSTILAIAKSRAVLGEYQPKFAPNNNRATARPSDGEPIPRYYGEGIIQEDQFYRVQRRIEQNRAKKGRQNGPRRFTNLFIGLCRCYECGGTVGMQTATLSDRWRRSDVLRCTNAGRNFGCTNRKRYAYAPLEAAIMRHVRDFELPTASRDATTDDLALAEGQLDELHRRLQKLLDGLEQDEGLDSKYIRQRVRERSDELAAKEEQVRSLRVQVRARAAMPAMPTGDALADLLARLDSAAAADLYILRASLNLALRDIVDFIDFDPNGDVRACILGGVKAYRFHDGEYVDAVDLTGGVGSVYPPESFAGGEPERERKLQRLIAA